MAESTVYFVISPAGGHLVSASVAEGTASEGHSSEGGATTGEGAGHGTSTEATAAQPDNPILPVMPELVWGGACFLVLWALMKFVLLKPVKAGMADRDDQVRSDIAAADQARVAADGAWRDYNAQLASAKAEATRLIEDARAQGEARRRELIAAAEADAAEARAAAAAEIAEAKAAALGQLRGEVASIAVQAAGTVIDKPLDVGSHQGVVDEYLSRASRN